jgi:hypothetical protein
MTVTAARPTGARVAVPAPSAPVDFFTDLGRQQMAVAAEASCALLRGFEAMRRIQQQAAQAARARHEAAAGKLRGACTGSDLMALQANLLQTDWQSANRYWQDLFGAALEMQVEMMGCASHLLDSETALEAASAVEALDPFTGVSRLFKRDAWFPLNRS